MGKGSNNRYYSRYHGTEKPAHRYLPPTALASIAATSVIAFAASTVVYGKGREVPTPREKHIVNEPRVGTKHGTRATVAVQM